MAIQTENAWTKGEGERGAFRVIPRGLLGLLVFCCCSSSWASGEPRPESSRQTGVRVVATTGMIGDLVSAIGGEQVRVRVLLGPGVDVHLYRPTVGDAALLSRADLIFYHGLQLEGRMARLLAKLAQTRPALAVAETLPSHMLRRVSGSRDAFDPHVWLDLWLWAHATSAIADALGRVDEARFPLYRRRARSYRDRMLLLDEWIQGRISEIPPSKRVLVTPHDSFWYFGRRYGMKTISIQGVSTVARASFSDIRRVARVVVETGIGTVFSESSVAKRPLNAVARALLSFGHVINVEGDLYSDSLGSPGSGAETYLGAMRHNVVLIAERLK